MEMNRPLRNVRLKCETAERQVAFQALAAQLVRRPASIVLVKTLKCGEVGGQALGGQQSTFRSSLRTAKIENQGLTFPCGAPCAEPGSAGAFAPRFARA